MKYPIIFFLIVSSTCFGQFNDKELFRVKLNEELKTFEKKFELLMSDRATANQSNRALEYLINKFAKNATIETVNSRGQKRRHYVSDYFINIRNNYLEKYEEYFDVELELILPTNEDIQKNGDGALTSMIKIRQSFTGQTRKYLFEDITAKLLLVETYKTYDSVSGRSYPYNIKFMGMKTDGPAEVKITPVPFKKRIKG